MSLCAVLAGPVHWTSLRMTNEIFFPHLLGEGSVWYKTHTQTLKGFCSSLIYYLQATHNSLWPCMVRKFPHTHTKKSTTSLDSFADQSSGCHTIRCYAARRDASWGQRCVTWHRGKSSLEICHVQLCTKDSFSPFVHFHLLPFFLLLLCFHSSIFLFFYIHLSHMSTKEWGSVLCPEGNFVVLSHLPTSNSQPPRATSEKMETVFCLGEDIWFM